MQYNRLASFWVTPGVLLCGTGIELRQTIWRTSRNSVSYDRLHINRIQPTSMATILFYEKPGCINNTRQKAMLKAAGHHVDARDLLTEAWTPDRLRSFLVQHTVSEWFNRSAPAIKSGAVDPDQLDQQTALQLMVQNPLLIRRPLIQVGEHCTVGFDVESVTAWIGLTPIDNGNQELYEHLKHQDLQTCPRSQVHPGPD